MPAPRLRLRAMFVAVASNAHLSNISHRYGRERSRTQRARMRSVRRIGERSGIVAQRAKKRDKRTRNLYLCDGG